MYSMQEVHNNIKSKILIREKLFCINRVYNYNIELLYIRHIIYDGWTQKRDDKFVKYNNYICQ